MVKIKVHIIDRELLDTPRIIHVNRTNVTLIGLEKHRYKGRGCCSYDDVEAFHFREGIRFFARIGMTLGEAVAMTTGAQDTFVN